MTSAEPLNRTPLYDLHRELGAKLVPFAGYEMPVQYPAGIIAEHLHTRAAAGLFDVSHMGQIRLEADSFDAAAAGVEVENTGSEPLVGLRYFGPDVHKKLPAVGEYRK